MTSIERLRRRLNETLAPLDLQIIDDSHRHAGHAGAAKGGHYRVHIVAEAFSGKPLIARHRMVYEALSENMRQEIHALSIVARAPEEVTDTSESGPPQS